MTSNRLRLKYNRFTPLGCKDIWIRQFEFMAKTKFLYQISAIIEAFLYTPNNKKKHKQMCNEHLFGQWEIKRTTSEISLYYTRFVKERILLK